MLKKAFTDLRPLMFSIAYRMTGSVADTEDIVAESFVRLHTALEDNRRIRNLKQYMATTVSRLSIDHLRSARMRRETYLGPWLPEPLVDTSADLAFDRVELADSLSMAFLVLLENLTPTERAVFLLREIFEFDYPAIADIIDKSVTNCRQILRRAKQQIDSGRPRFDTDTTKRDQIADGFFTAIEDGNLDPLLTLLSEDVVMYGDGGGNGPSLPKPINGREKVMRVLAVLANMSGPLGLRMEHTRVNGQPGALVRTADDQLVNVLTIDIRDGRVHTVRSVINPDKLYHLGPLADVVTLNRRFVNLRRPPR